MTRYSIHFRNLMFVKGYGFLSFAKKWIKISVKIEAKTLAVNTPITFLIILENPPEMCLKLFQKQQFKKQQKQFII